MRINSKASKNKPRAICTGPFIIYNDARECDWWLTVCSGKDSKRLYDIKDSATRYYYYGLAGRYGIIASRNGVK